ncbi:uncharacterized protein F4822DRAFT_423324 [Hypoxylon trugodes]|uniref:uncharacterized protein n=1 Tax=Hypoxylon trugodes TaxID=326681 RepID=UPI00219A2E20|nr:uncharacterized protein F4822DRAFT_423324 [Hypoxylon trugodes]KAI1382720.1 hypothetical protein F4822DRAFT_423324 [Hypoxylon trugodes]
MTSARGWLLLIFLFMAFLYSLMIFRIPPTHLINRRIHADDYPIIFIFISAMTSTHLMWKLFIYRQTHLLLRVSPFV